MKSQTGLTAAFAALLIAGCTVYPSSEPPPADPPEDLPVVVEFSVDSKTVQHNHTEPAVTATDDADDPDTLLIYFDEQGNTIGTGRGSVPLRVEWTGKRQVSAECFCGEEKLGVSNGIEVTGLDTPPGELDLKQAGDDDSIVVTQPDKKASEWDVYVPQGESWQTYITFADVNGDTGEVVFDRCEDSKHKEVEVRAEYFLTLQPPEAGEAGRALFSWTTPDDETKSYFLYFKGYIPHHNSYSGEEAIITIHPNNDN